MVKKRIIPCLDICNGRTVKGVNFVELRDAGDPIELAQRYINDGADELVFLDISATIEKRKTLAELVEKIAKNINIPFTVGGGIHSLEDARTVIKSGADKISINSSAVQNPSLISAIANEFGSQCVVVAIDTKFVNTTWMVFSKILLWALSIPFLIFCMALGIVDGLVFREIRIAEYASEGGLLLKWLHPLRLLIMWSVVMYVVFLDISTLLFFYAGSLLALLITSLMTSRVNKYI